MRVPSFLSTAFTSTVQWKVNRKQGPGLCTRLFRCRRTVRELEAVCAGWQGWMGKHGAAPTK